MRRIALIALSVLAAGGGAAAVAGADDSHTYEIEMYNAFGIVEGSQIRVAGVTVGSVIDLTVNSSKRAVATVELSGDLAQLGEDTTCEASPQSLLAEYYIDCQPAGEELPEGGRVPASQVGMAVQPDLVANTMREPFRTRLTLIVNEFGTALAGNPENLREAIRLGAPALTELEEVTSILANQAKAIRDLNVNSEKVSGELARYREQIVDFVDEAEDTARTALERREDVSRGFDLFDDYIAELRPTLSQLNDTAQQQAPLLAGLRDAAPDLYRLTQSMPPFQRASEDSLRTLGDAAVVGERALRHGREELEQLADAGRKAPMTSEILADFLRDLDDPRRAVEIDERAGQVTGRTSKQPGRRNTMGYTGLEGLLNYPYYQGLALNQFDQFGHSLHINLYEVFNTFDCGGFISGRDPNDPAKPGVPAKGGGTTTKFKKIARCGTWLGPNQPGINEDLDLPKYHPSVCPGGTEPDHARIHLCDPNDPAKAGDSNGAAAAQAGAPSTARQPDQGGPESLPGPGDDLLPELPGDGDATRPLDELLEGLDRPIDGLRDRVPGGDRGNSGSRAGARELLDYLLGS